MNAMNVSVTAIESTYKVLHGELQGGQDINQVNCDQLFYLEHLMCLACAEMPFHLFEINPDFGS
jgi:hypothetical protein